MQAGGAGALAFGASGCFGDSEDEASAGADAGNEPNGSNVVLITIDTVRADHVGAYGSKRVKTPNMDAFAKEGVRFSDAVPEGMPTVPARRAIFSGRRSFPFRNWKAEPSLPQSPGWMSIPDHQVTWLEWAKRAGLTTAMSTDIPFIVGPRFDGFRSKIDMVRAVPGEPPLRDRPGKLVGDDVLAPYLLPALKGTEQEQRLRAYLTVNPPGRPERDHLAPRTFQGGMDMLDRLKDQQPFALVVDTFGPHEAWDPPAKYIGMYDEPKRRGIEPIQPFLTPFGVIEELGIDDDMLERIRNLYAAEMTFVDAWLGRFLDKLEDAGLADKTTVLLISDHGMTLGERGVIGKNGSVAYSEVYHVPFMMRDPERRGAGTTSAFHASTHDVGPTLLAAAGVRVPGSYDGEDLGAIFTGEEPPERPVFTAAYGGHVIAGDKDWFLLADNPGKDKKLFRRNDETKDVAAQHRDQVERLWGAIVDQAGGPLPELGPKGAVGL
jgi:arylsulfatase A-like enzyme